MVLINVLVGKAGVNKEEESFLFRVGAKESVVSEHVFVDFHECTVYTGTNDECFISISGDGAYFSLWVNFDASTLFFA